MTKVQQDLLASARAAINWDQILNHKRSILCALSGGPDSTALCDILDRLRAELDFKLHATHLNHGIRGAEADADESFVEKFCEDRNIPLILDRTDVPSEARVNDVSIEMAARVARYEFFDQITTEVGTNILALGHTANDRVENLLMRLLRGAGGRGLGSLQPVRKYGNLVLIRPLLSVFKHEILDYLEWRGLSWRMDTTNLDESTDRGRIRNVLLPGFLDLAYKSGWNKPLESLARSASLLSEDEEFFQKLVKEHSSDINVDKNDELHLPIARLNALPSPILGRIILDAIQKLEPGLRPEREHVTLLIEMIRGRRTGACDLPGGLRAELSDDNVIVHDPANVQHPEPIVIPLDELPTSRQFGSYKLEISRLIDGNHRTQTDVESSHGRISIALQPDCHSIVVRGISTGDRMAPLGMGGHTKKISDIFIDKKVPRNLRPFEPVLALEPDGDVVALPGLNIISETVKISSASGVLLIIATVKV